MYALPKRKAAQIHSLGWESAAGAALWARALSDELARHELGRESYGAGANQEALERLPRAPDECGATLRRLAR
jgi:hypothetical protein